MRNARVKDFELRIAALTADLDTMREDRDEHFAALVKCAERITELTAELDRWMSNAHGAQKLSLEYLRERDRYREALGELMDRSAVLAVLEDNQRQGYLKLLNALNREE